MTVIVNNDPTIDESINADVLVRDFFLNTLAIDLTGKSLKLTFDQIGRINEIDVDPTVSLTAPQIIQVQNEFYGLSVDTIINSLGTSTPAHITTYLTGFDSENPLTVTTGGEDIPSDIVSVDNWSVDISNDFTVTDDDIGEVQYTGIIPITRLVSFSISLASVSGTNRRVYGDIMRKPDAGSYSEVAGSRVHTDDSANNDVKNTSITIRMTINPLDKLKTNVGKMIGTQNIIVSNASLTV